MEICSVEAGTQNDYFYSDEVDADEPLSEEGLNESGVMYIHPHVLTCTHVS